MNTKSINKLSGRKDEYVIVKCLIKKHDGSEEWIKKEGDDIDDYSVIDKLIELDYVYDDVYQIIV